MRTREISLRVILPTNIDSAYRAITNWTGQSDWMLATKVWLSKGDGNSIGSEVSAFTGFGKLGFLDTMTITKLNPPRSVEVLHTGKVLRGIGKFELSELAEDKTQFDWYEQVEIPLGYFGLLAWWLIRPGFTLGVRISLRKLAKTL